MLWSTAASLTLTRVSVHPHTLHLHSPTLLLFTIAAPQTKYRRRFKQVVIRTWPRSSFLPPCHAPTFDKWALSQLCLFKLYHTHSDLTTPTIKDVFDCHVHDYRFPTPSPSLHPDSVHADDDNSGPDVDLASGSAAPLETDLHQDDYQQVMLHTHPACTNTSLLRFHELDLAHQWPTLWFGVLIDWLLTWLSSTKERTTLPPPTLPPFTLSSLSQKQCTDRIQHCPKTFIQ